MKNIAIIYGGKSVEHDISVITALQTMANLPKNYNLIPIYIKIDGKMVTADNLNIKEIYLDYQKNVKNENIVAFLPASGCLAMIKNDKIKKKIKIDCALLCTHGHGGEDGSLQGLLEMCEVPYTSSSLASSALCMDKVLTKIVVENAKLPTPAYLHFCKCEYDENKTALLKEIDKKIGYPCIVKPASGGSSVGIGICENAQMIEGVIENAIEYDNKIIVEKFIENAREFCCAVVKIGGQLIPSKIVEVKKGKMFSFEDKYLSPKEGGKNKIDASVAKQVQKTAIETYSALECDGVVRIDFLLGDKLYVNEVNSIPGSLSFNMFETTFADLIEVLISEGINRFEGKRKLLYSFSSSAIENYISTTKNMKFKA